MKMPLLAVLLGAVLTGCGVSGPLLPPDNSDKVQMSRTIPSGG